MVRVVRAGLIQAGMGDQPADDAARSKKYMLEKHFALIEEAAGKGVQVLCLQEISTCQKKSVGQLSAILKR